MQLLLHSSGAYYFFRPIPKASAQKIDKLDLYMIPDADVLAIHLQRGIDSGGGKSE